MDDDDDDDDMDDDDDDYQWDDGQEYTVDEPFETPLLPSCDRHFEECPHCKEGAHNDLVIIEDTTMK